MGGDSWRGGQNLSSHSTRLLPEGITRSDGLFVQHSLPSLLVIRTRRPFFQSRPGKHLLWATLAIVAVTLLIPVSSLAGPLEFVLPPPVFLAVLAGILLLYILKAEIAKRMFYARVGRMS